MATDLRLYTDGFYDSDSGRVLRDSGVHRDLRDIFRGGAKPLFKVGRGDDQDLTLAGDVTADGAVVFQCFEGRAYVRSYSNGAAVRLWRKGHPKPETLIAAADDATPVSPGMAIEIPFRVYDAEGEPIGGTTYFLNLDPPTR